MWLLIFMLLCSPAFSQTQTTTFVATLEFNSEAVIAFAEYIGWKSTVSIVNEDGETINNPNPITAEEYIATSFKEYSYGFTLQYAEYIKQQEIKRALSTIEARLDAELVNPIKQATNVEVIQ